MDQDGLRPSYTILIHCCVSWVKSMAPFFNTNKLAHRTRDGNKQTSSCYALRYSVKTRPVCSVLVAWAVTSRRHRDLGRQSTAAAAGADQILLAISTHTGEDIVTALGGHSFSTHAYISRFKTHPPTHPPTYPPYTHKLWRHYNNTLAYAQRWAPYPPPSVCTY